MVFSWFLPIFALVSVYEFRGIRDGQYVNSVALRFKIRRSLLGLTVNSESFSSGFALFLSRLFQNIFAVFVIAPRATLCDF